MPAFARPLPSALALVVLATLGACGGQPPPADKPPPRQPTVFDDLVNKKQEVPAAVELAQRQHMDETRRAIDAADAPPPDENKR